jgi:hypothetical protein
MSRKKIKLKKANFSNKVRELKTMANHIKAIDQAISSLEYDFGKEPNLSGRSDISFPVGSVPISVSTSLGAEEYL